MLKCLVLSLLISLIVIGILTLLIFSFVFVIDTFGPAGFASYIIGLGVIMFWVIIYKACRSG